jgi:hypothetical protein
MKIKIAKKSPSNPQPMRIPKEFLEARRKKIVTKKIKNASKTLSSLQKHIGIYLPKEFPYAIRLPKVRNKKKGEKAITEPSTKKSEYFCPYTGLSRSQMNTLILPCKANNFNPPVKSISMGDGKKSSRLILYVSLIKYLHSRLIKNSSKA